MVLHSIQNLIFDLGGVILDLHLDRTHQAFASTGGRQVEEMKSTIEASPFFNEYEKGLISDDEFRNQIRRMLGKDLPDVEIDIAWNAMLGGIPAERLNLLRRLRGHYRIFLLSNTNNIHLQCFDPMVKAAIDHADLNSFFEVAYYSHLLKMRKPDREIFDHVLSENKLHPASTLFLDDNLSNLEGAAVTGIKTFHVQHPDQMMSLFK